MHIIIFCALIVNTDGSGMSRNNPMRDKRGCEERVRVSPESGITIPGWCTPPSQLGAAPGTVPEIPVKKQYDKTAERHQPPAVSTDSQAQPPAVESTKEVWPELICPGLATLSVEPWSTPGGTFLQGKTVTVFSSTSHKYISPLVGLVLLGQVIGTEAAALAFITKMATYLFPNYLWANTSNFIWDQLNMGVWKWLLSTVD